MSWLASNGTNLAVVGWNGFSSSLGVWTQVVATNLVAPAGTVNARIEIYGATGAVANGYGEVLIDDVALAANAPSQTNVLAVIAQPQIQVGWSSTAGKSYDVRWTENLAGNTWSNLVSAVAGNGITNVVYDSISNSHARFYRVVQLAP